MLSKLFIFAASTLMALSAHAYIGPGVGAGAIATVLGLLGALLMAVVGLVYFPIKRMIKKRKARQTEAQAD